MNRRPNLGLFRPITAPHLREKGVGGLPTSKPPIGNKKYSHGQILYVKLEFSILRRLIIEKHDTLFILSGL